MPPRRHPTDKLIEELPVLPPIKKGQRSRRSRTHAFSDAKALATAIEQNKSRKVSQFKAMVEGSRAQGSLGGKRHRKTAKRRRAKKSCGFFW